MIFPATLGLLFPWLAAAGVLPSGSLVPRRVVSGEWQEVMTTLREDGAVIVTNHVVMDGTENFRNATLQLPHELFDGQLGRPSLWSPDAPASAVHEELEEAKRRGKYLPGSGLLPHTDGYVYGDHLPDFVSLLCESPSSEGGGNTLIDGQTFLASLDPALVHWLETTPVDLSEGDAGITVGRAAAGPVIQRFRKRLKWRRQINVEEAKLTESWRPLDLDPSATTKPSVTVSFRYVSLWKPLPNASVEEASEIKKKLEILDRHLQEATKTAEETALFYLEAGEALILDNWRLLHARKPYKGTRKMWRIWSWTSDGSGLPADGAKTSQPLNDAVFGAEKKIEL